MHEFAIFLILATKMPSEEIMFKSNDENDFGHKLSRLDAEVISFYEFCQKMGFTAKEMEEICSPLKDFMSKRNVKQAITTTFVIILASLAVYGGSRLTELDHAAALGRIALIKSLHLYDWTYLFYENCLFENPFYGEERLTRDDCELCETIGSVDIESDTTYDKLIDHYFSRDIPVIVGDGMMDWPLFKNVTFHFMNITEIFLNDERLMETVPCFLNSNLGVTSDLRLLLKKINNLLVKNWFIHWQNCDIFAVKATRRFYFRPYFISNTISPPHFNWILMSSNYASKNFKKIDLDPGLIMLLQLRGSTIFKLTPVYPCNDTCPSLLADLKQGEILAFKNDKWIFEYRPGLATDNIALLSETIWDVDTPK